MKKCVIAFLVILSAMCCGLLLCACAKAVRVYTVTYVSNECGYIYHLDEQGNQVKGTVKFTVESGDDATEIIACPNDGYLTSGATA